MIDNVETNHFILVVGIQVYRKLVVVGDGACGKTSLYVPLYSLPILRKADFVDASLAHALFIVRTRLNVYVNGMFPVCLTDISTRGATLIARIINSQSMNLRSSKITPRTSCCESDTMYLHAA